MKTLFSPRNVSFLVGFSILSGLLGYAKLPGTGSIALDSAPGYFVAGYVHPVIGGLVGLMGHLASAATGGFPLGWVHAAIAIQMFFWCLLFGLIIRKIDRVWALWLAAAVSCICNGVLAPLMLGLVGLIPMSVATGLIVVLLLASGINIALASGLVFFFSRSKASDL